MLKGINASILDVSPTLTGIVTIANSTDPTKFITLSVNTGGVFNVANESAVNIMTLSQAGLDALAGPIVTYGGPGNINTMTMAAGASAITITAGGGTANQDVQFVPAGTGVVRGVAPPTGDNSTAIPTTAWVQTLPLVSLAIPGSLTTASHAGYLVKLTGAGTVTINAASFTAGTICKVWNSTGTAMTISASGYSATGPDVAAGWTVAAGAKATIYAVQDGGGVDLLTEGGLT